MSRTVRKDLDGTTVHDGKAYKAWNIRSDGGFIQAYNRSESRKLLRDEILQYIRENGGSTTTQILQHFLQKSTTLGLHETWTILEILDELTADGLIQ